MAREGGYRLSKTQVDCNFVILFSQNGIFSLVKWRALLTQRQITKSFSLPNTPQTHFILYLYNMKLLIQYELCFFNTVHFNNLFSVGLFVIFLFYKQISYNYQPPYPIKNIWSSKNWQTRFGTCFSGLIKVLFYIAEKFTLHSKKGDFVLAFFNSIWSSQKYKNKWCA